MILEHNLNYYVDMTQHIRNLSLMTCFCLPQYICILTLDHLFFSLKVISKHTSCEFKERSLQHLIL